MNRAHRPVGIRVPFSRAAGLGLLLAVMVRPATAILPERQESPALRTLPHRPLLVAPPAPGGYSDAPAGLSAKEVTAKAVELTGEQAWQSFTRETGGWSVRWNVVTGTPHLATGRPHRLPGYDKLTRDNIEPATRAFIDAHADLMRVKSARLRLEQAVQAGGRWYVTFRQVQDGVPVLGGHVTLSFTKDDRLILFGSGVYPNVVANVTPAVPAGEAVRIARLEAKASPTDQVRDVQLVVVPLPKPAGFSYALAWQFTLAQPAAHRKWQYVVDARNGEILGKWNRLVYADAGGQVQLEYKPEFAGDPVAVDLARHEDVRATGPEVMIQSWDMETNPGWSLSGQWAYGVPQGGGAYLQDPTAGYTGANVVGYNLAGDYPNNMSTTEYATTPAVDCTGQANVWLRFYRWLGVEDSYWDHASIQVSSDEVNWTTVWENAGAVQDTGWSRVEYDLSAVAANQPTVYIRWGMGPTDGSVTYPGWNIDDVELVSYIGGVVTTQTEADGMYTVTPPADPFCISAYLRGAFCQIQHAGGGDSLFSLCGQPPGATVNWTWDSNVYHRIDEPSVYRHVNFIHDYYKTIDPDFTGLDYPMPTTVYIPDFSNAYWDGTGITFGGGDGTYYGNFGLYSEVVYHEYTHGVTDRIYTGINFPYAMEPGAMNEGFSDYFGCALSISQTYMVGDGGLVIGYPDGFRTLGNNYRREIDWYNEVHEDSQMFAGGLWEARQILGSSIMDEMVHFARYAHPTTFEDYLTALLVEDDTRYGDSDLTNGTPHGQTIYESFGHHGIGGLRYVAGSLTLSDAAGNGNGRLEPGETADVSVSLVNGWADATAISATLNTTDPYVTILKTTANFPDATHGASVDNASDTFQIALSPDCPDTHTVTFTIDLSAAGPYSYSADCVLRYPVAVGQLRADDGELDTYLGWGRQSAGRATAVRLTPTTYPCYVTYLRLQPYQAGRITVQFWDDDGPGGSPGTVLGSTNVNVTPTGDWVDVDVASLAILVSEGSIYAGWVEATDDAFYNGVDNDPPYQGRSWLYSGSWRAAEEYGVLCNMMIRLQTSSEPPVQIEPPYEFTWSVNVPVHDCLTANRGTPPYTWSVIPLPPTYTSTIQGSSLFDVVGDARAWQADDGSWSYNLPFPFSFYGQTYTRVNVCSNGFLDFANSSPDYANSSSNLSKRVMIAALWDDLRTDSGDIFIDESVPDQVTIRWQAVTFNSGSPANFAVVLFSNGDIRLDYGSCTGLSPTVGISSGSGSYMVVSGYDGRSNMTDYSSVLLQPDSPVIPLPPGISMDSSGCFSGICPNAGTYTAKIKVTDSSSPQLAAIQQFTFRFMAGADLNRDGVVSVADVLVFNSCMSGAQNPPAPTCPPGVIADLDGDLDVDQSDYGLLQKCILGPGFPVTVCP